MELLFIGMALIVVVGGLLARGRIERARRQAGLDDEMIQRIERAGELEFDPAEPLDHEEIRQEEDEFWAQSWDEPEEL